jgi:two-component system invasion response regulator UvrY
MKTTKWFTKASLPCTTAPEPIVDSPDPQNTSSVITILIVDDHALIRENWIYFLKRDPRFMVVGECGSGEEAIELSKKLKPDVVLMDINLSGISGVEATSQIIREIPMIRVIGVSLHAQPFYARKMMQQGARGYVTKNSPRHELIQAIIDTRAGKKFICEEIKNILSERRLCGTDCSSQASALSAQEIRVLGKIKNGYSSRDIACELNISEKTVEIYRYNILKKLNLKNTTGTIPCTLFK